MGSGLWRPLLDGDLASRAWEAVSAITRDIEAWSPADHPDDERLDRGFSLGGRLGQALFHGYLAEALAAETAAAEHQAERAQQLLDVAIEALAAVPMSPALYSGFTGVAWAAEHLERRLGGGEEPQADEDEDMNEEIDEALLTALTAPWKGDYDLISGLVGFGVYALERFPRPGAVRCLEAIVDRLDETAERNGQDVTWFTPPEMLPSISLEQTPLGCYNLGVAHGVPGVIPLLADICRLGIRQERARALLDGAVHWLLPRHLGEQKGARYPTWVAPGIESRPSRLAWCYGDPGIAATLLHAARALGVEEWERHALEIGAHAARAAQEDAAIRDAGLCHGAIGLAHLYNRIHQTGGGDLFADAARLWYRRGLDLRKPGSGVGGFESWLPAIPGQAPGWQTDPGFLTGSAGIGLGLLAALTPVEPEWDRLLLVAIPPRG